MPIERAYLVGQHNAGKSFSYISSETSVLKSIIINTVKNTFEYSNTKSLLQGSLCKSDLWDNQILYYKVRKGPQVY